MGFYVIQFCGIIISQNMRNIFLCFFALFLFAPEMAGAAGRTVQKNDSNTDSARVTNSVRTTASRATTNTASRTKSTQTGAHRMRNRAMLQRAQIQTQPHRVRR